MSKPKKWDSMTTEEQESWMENKRKICRKWRKENPQRNRDLNNKWKRENPNKVRDSVYKWMAKNPEKVKSYKKSQAALERNREFEKTYLIVRRKKREENPLNRREIERKSREKLRNQAAADQFFILAGAAQTITEAISKLKNK